MKVSKKLISLLLVVMLLATAIPFQAFAAADGDELPFGVQVIWGEGENDCQEFVLSATAAAKDAYTAEQAKQVIGKYNDPAQYAITKTEGPMFDGVDKYVFVIEVEPVASTKDYSVVVKCGDTSCEKTVETCPTAVTMTAADAEAKKNATGAQALVESAGANVATKALVTSDNFQSMFISGNTITIYVKDCGDTQNPDLPTTTKVAITIVDSVKGNTTNNVAIGSYYGDAVGTRAEPGYEFRGWLSTNLGRMVDLNKDIVTAADTLTAIWSAPTGYHVTYKLNYTDAPLITSGFTATQGEHIYNKLYSYKPTRQGYVFRGWQILGTIIKETNDEFIYQSDVDAIAIWDKASNLDPDTALPNEKDGIVWLWIYVNGDTAHAKKQVDVTSYCKDGSLTRAEAEKVVKKYVTAKAGYSLAYEGLFNEETWHWFKNDPETDGAASIPADLWDDQHIYVMVNNVKVVAADPDNYKTGDYALTTALTMMAITGVAAAAVYVVGKKRA